MKFLRLAPVEIPAFWGSFMGSIPCRFFKDAVSYHRSWQLKAVLDLDHGDKKLFWTFCCIPCQVSMEYAVQRVAFTTLFCPIILIMVQAGPMSSAGRPNHVRASRNLPGDFSVICIHCFIPFIERMGREFFIN